MVEMDYLDPDGSGRAEYDSFYDRHIGMLLSIPGFLVAQRFEACEQAAAPFLAIYQLAAPHVLESEEYLSRAGRMSVPETYRQRMQNWDRNLVLGDIDSLTISLADNRERGTVLNLIDRSRKNLSPLPPGFTSLRPIGLDRTFSERGAMVGKPCCATPQPGWTQRTFRPLHDARTAP